MLRDFEIKTFIRSFKVGDRISFDIIIENVHVLHEATITSFEYDLNTIRLDQHMYLAFQPNGDITYACSKPVGRVPYLFNQVKNLNICK